MDRDFKGVWIPREIWLDKRLDVVDKVVLTEINSLDNENHCNAGNDYLAEFCQCSQSKVSSSIKKLITLGYLEQVSFDGRHRILKSNIRVVNFNSQPCEINKAAFAENDANNIYNNINNNINNITPNKEELDKLKEHFDIIWEEYPNKKGKAKAFVYFLSWIKGRKIGGINVKVTDRQQWYAVMRYKAECEKNKTEEKYIKHGDTFFNNAILDYVKDIEEDEPL